MWRKQLLAKKTLEMLDAEAKGENRLRRVLGTVGLTSLGVGAIIGAGIFVMTGRAAAQDAGPAILISFVVAGLGCLFAALCYAEFASMAPVAGSAYTYAYATLGEIFAWIIGWDLILEYAMACACVAAEWSGYLNALLTPLGRLVGIEGLEVPAFLCSDPFTAVTLADGSVIQPWFNLPAVLIILAVTGVLVIGIRESATTNAVLVAIKVGVVLFVIGVGVFYINPANWTSVPAAERILPEQLQIPDQALAEVEKLQLGAQATNVRAGDVSARALAQYKLERKEIIAQQRLDEGAIDAATAADLRRQARSQYEADLAALQASAANRVVPLAPLAEDQPLVNNVLQEVRAAASEKQTAKWGLLGSLGLNRWLIPIDDAVRGPFSPYGLAGIIFAASIVFFAYIGFDSISTHAEEARHPQRDVPIAILASLVLCTLLYIGVAAVLTGMIPYPNIDPKAAVAKAFTETGEATGSTLLQGAGGLIAIGALAGMTSVLLITFLSQARIFLAMARDGLLPPAIFAAVHPRFRTPHLSTMLTGGVIAIVSAFTPILTLGELVNIGTLLAFVIVCGAVLMLRIQRPDAPRPFRCPAIYVVAPLGILVNLIMMLFLPIGTWLRLLAWLCIGLLIYFGYGLWYSSLGMELRRKATDSPGAALPPDSPQSEPAT
jgi:amino acid transporter